MIKRVLITSDLLRPLIADGKIEYFHKIRLNKYFHFLSYPVSRAVTVPVEKFNWETTDFDFYTFYHLCGLELSGYDSWLKIYDLKNIPSAVIEYYGKYIKDSLVIYHEIPAILKNIHRQLDIPYIDINVHPIRYMDDNFWGFHTNSEKIFDRIKKYQPDEGLFFIHAGILKAVTDLHAPEIEENTALIAGQTTVDKSLYNNGRVMTIFDFEDKIIKLGKQYGKVYYKPHPFNYELDNILSFLKKFVFVEVINENIYRLMSSDKLKEVCAITSGSLYEAKYFDKKASFWGEPYLHFDYSHDCAFSEHTCLSVYNDFISPDFWSNILQDVTETRTCSEINIPLRANRIRAAFGDYWSQTELDAGILLAEKQFRKEFDELQWINGLQWQEIEKLKWKLKKRDGEKLMNRIMNRFRK